MEQQTPPMNFFKKVLRSVYGPTYYQELIEKPFSYSVKYFALFTSIVAVLAVAGFSTFYFPKINTMLRDAVRSVADNYPQDLEVTVKSGNISINKDEPYFVKLPASVEKVENQLDKVENLIVIDTKSEASANNLRKYKAAALVTKNYIIYQKEEGQIVTQSLEKVADVVINKTAIASFIEKYSPYLKLLYPLSMIGFFIFFFLLILFRLCYLFLAALLIWLIAHIKGVKISYGKSYQLGLHLMTLPLLLISPFIPINFPFAFTLLLMIMAFVNIKKAEVIIDATPTQEIEKPVSDIENKP